MCHYADYPIHLFKFVFSSEYVAPILCKDNFDGLCYVCYVRGKHINKYFGVYSVFGLLDKQGYSFYWASSDCLLNDLPVFPSFGLSFCFWLFVFIHIVQKIIVFHIYKDKIISKIKKRDRPHKRIICLSRSLSFNSRCILFR